MKSSIARCPIAVSLFALLPMVCGQEQQSAKIAADRAHKMALTSMDRSPAQNAQLHRGHV